MSTPKCKKKLIFFQGEFFDISWASLVSLNSLPSYQLGQSFELLNLRPENCLVVEDNINGIKSAKSSKAHVMEIREIEEERNLSQRVRSGEDSKRQRNFLR